MKLHGVDFRLNEASRQYVNNSSKVMTIDKNITITLVLFFSYHVNNRKTKYFLESHTTTVKVYIFKRQDYIINISLGIMLVWSRQTIYEY